VKHVVAALLFAACVPAPKSPTANGLIIDRFSARAGHLQVRTPDNGLPPPGAPIDFDRGLITQSRGPAGEIIRYYNFDVQPTRAGVFYDLGEAGDPVIDAIPGDDGYSDFVQRITVTVPAGTPPEQLRDARALKNFAQRATGDVLNRPVVPPGSTAKVRLNGAPAGTESGWYRGQRVQWFRFDETKLGLDDNRVPTSPIYVTFRKNPGTPGGGPASGFVTEPGGVQTHNVAGSLPGDVDYSPLWSVNVYDNAAFPTVHDEASVQKAKILAHKVATVNCPIVDIK
jgi:hypothetical protein